VPKETVYEKSFRLLKESRLTVERVDDDGGWVVARCQGDTGSYALGFDPITKSFRCTCPNVKGDCSHIYALRLIVDRP